MRQSPSLPAMASAAGWVGAQRMELWAFAEVMLPIHHPHPQAPVDPQHLENASFFKNPCLPLDHWREVPGLTRAPEPSERCDFTAFVDNMKTSKRNLNSCYRADKRKVKYKIKAVN